MERVVVHLAKGLAKRDSDVLVVCLQKPGLLASELTDTNVRLIALNSFDSKDFRAVWKLKRELTLFNPSIINVHDYTSLPYAVAANALNMRAPILFTAHGLLYEGFDKPQRRNRFFAKFISSISAVSAKVADRHHDYLGWSKPIKLTANGVPDHKDIHGHRDRVRTQLGCQPGTHLFLAVGNPRPEKGFEDLIDSVALLRDRIGHIGVQHAAPLRNFMIVVAGTLIDSDYCKMLLCKTEELCLQKYFKLLGFRQDTVALYSAADAFVLSSRSEGLPMVVLEAMMAGLPVVSTRVGGIPDAVGDHALLVDPAQPAQLAQAMQKLIEDNGLAEKLGATGKEHVVNTFGVERMVDSYIEWYGKFST